MGHGREKNRWVEKQKDEYFCTPQRNFCILLRSTLSGKKYFESKPKREQEECKLVMHNITEVIDVKFFNMLTPLLTLLLAVNFSNSVFILVSTILSLLDNVN